MPYEKPRSPFVAVCAYLVVALIAIVVLSPRALGGAQGETQTRSYEIGIEASWYTRNANGISFFYGKALSLGAFFL